MNAEPASSPIAFFAAELKRFRAQAEMTQEDLARATMYSPATVAAIETCRLLASAEFALQADKALNADGHFERLQALAEQSSALPFFRDLFETERKASSIRNYESYLVPGLTQTGPYARFAIGASRPKLPAEEVERAVALRLSRQEILNRDEARFWFILDESALRRRLGGPEVMREQCEQLLLLGSRPNVAIQVIPEAKGAVAAYGQSFMVLSFPRKQPSMAYLEDMRSARYLREKDDVGAYSVTFDYLRSSAMDDDDSEAMIRSYRDGYS